MHTQVLDFPLETASLKLLGFCFFLLFQNTEAEKGGPRCVCLPHESPSLPPKVSFFLNSPLVDTRFVFLCFKTVRSDKDRGNPERKLET